MRGRVLFVAYTREEVSAFQAQIQEVCPFDCRLSTHFTSRSSSIPNYTEYRNVNTLNNGMPIDAGVTTGAARREAVDIEMRVESETVM